MATKSPVRELRELSDTSLIPPKRNQRVFTVTEGGRGHLAQDRPRKVALIGASGYEHGSPEARVECFMWERLKKAGNLADYDILILNLLSVENMGSLDADAIMEVLSVRTMLEVLFSGPEGPSGSSIIVLGDPRGNT